MNEIQTGCFPVSEKTVWSEIPEVMAVYGRIIYEKFGDVGPALILEPHPPWRLPSQIPKVSEAPEELIIIPVDPLLLKASFKVLEDVEAREPKLPKKKKTEIIIKGNTPMKSIFRQMAAIPVTVFSVTVGADTTDPVTIFFLRTAFTISEFRRGITGTVIE